MSANRLVVAGLMASFLGVAPACQSGGESGGAVGAVSDDFNGLLGSQGFGTPQPGAAPAAGTSDGLAFTPGFGAPPYSASAGAAGSGPVAFAPGFGGPPGSSGSVPVGSPGGGGGQRISDLSEADAEQFCQSLEQRFAESFSANEAARLSCTFAALGQTRVDVSTGQQVVDPDACQAALEACLESSAGRVTTIECDPDDFLASAGSCDATIGEVQACFDASFGRIGQLLEVIDCQSTPAAAASALSGLSAAAPQCAELQSECPGLIGTGGVQGMPGIGGSGGSSGSGATGGRGGSGGSGGSDAEPGGLCENTCRWANDGACDDGGPGMDFAACDLGTDCVDCGPR